MGNKQPQLTSPINTSRQHRSSHWHETQASCRLSCGYVVLQARTSTHTLRAVMLNTELMNVKARKCSTLCPPAVNLWSMRAQIWQAFMRGLRSIPLSITRFMFTVAARCKLTEPSVLVIRGTARLCMFACAAIRSPSTDASGSVSRCGATKPVTAGKHSASDNASCSTFKPHANP